MPMHTTPMIAIVAINNRDTFHVRLITPPFSVQCRLILLDRDRYQVPGQTFPHKHRSPGAVDSVKKHTPYVPESKVTKVTEGLLLQEADHAST